MRKKAVPVSCLLLLPAFLLCACSGGGGSSTAVTAPSANADALVVAEKVSVVDAQTSTPSANRVSRLFRIFRDAEALPATSDYKKDPTNTYVEERSTEGFNTVNEILCMIGQTKYNTMLNQGAYKAQIDSNQCSSSKSDASSAGQSSTNQSSSSSMPQYEMWTVDATRADNDSPQVVKVWIHEDATEHEPAKVIFAKMEITEGKSDSNPYGIFTINFRGAPAADLTQDMFKGTLKSERDSVTGKVLLKFIESGTDGANARSNAVTLDRSTDGSSGAGSLLMSRTEDHGGTPVEMGGSFNIAYNSAKFLRKDRNTSGEVCLSRTSFNESAWRYGVYDTDGARVARNSGFPIQKDGAYGWVGYWGLWLPQGVAVNNGDTVNKHDYSTNTDTPYTVLKAGGKLKKHTRKTMALGDIKNIPLNWSVCEGMTCQNYQVIWNGTLFQTIAQQDQSNYTWTSMTPVALDLSALNWGELNFYSQSLGGQARVKLNTDPASPDPHCVYSEGKYDCSGEGILSATSPVVFYAEDIIYPTDEIPATLACFDNCPNADASGVVTSAPFLPPDPANAKTYTFDATTMVLKYGGNDVVLNSAIPGQSWGIMSGAMFEPSTANLDLLKCDWDPEQTCGWKAWSELPVFYSWETGLNDYNKFTVLQDGSGAVVRFDPPLQITYTHSQTDTSAPDYKYNGSKFFLDYAGFGNLQGIPGICVNMNTGLEADCSASGGSTPIQWVAAFTIPNGATATDSTNTYYIKALEKSQRMKQDPEGCAELSASLLDYTLPTIADWVDPAIGDEPTVTTPPAVIGGIVQ